MIIISKCIDNKLIIQPNCESVSEPRLPRDSSLTNPKVPEIPSAIKNMSL